MDICQVIMYKFSCLIQLYIQLVKLITNLLFLYSIVSTNSESEEA